jgi:hypothetical protein
MSIFHWSDIKILSFVNNQKSGISRDAPNQLERERGLQNSRLFMRDQDEFLFCYYSVDSPVLSYRQIFSGVRFFGGFAISDISSISCTTVDTRFLRADRNCPDRMHFHHSIPCRSRIIDQFYEFNTSFSMWNWWSCHYLLSGAVEMTWNLLNTLSLRSEVFSVASRHHIIQFPCWNSRYT